MPASLQLRRLLGALPLAIAALGAFAPASRAADTSGLKIKEVQTSAPIKNFRLPTFTKEGWRDMMLKAAEARVLSAERIEVADMTLTLYTNDVINQPETVVTSPQAAALPSAQRVEGKDSVHVKRSDFELTGRDWSYDHATKKISIGSDAHVILQTEIKDLLK